MLQAGARGPVGFVLLAALLLLPAGSALVPPGCPSFLLCDPWSERYDGAALGIDRVLAVGLSPDGARSFSVGTSWGGANRNDLVIAAHDAATGSEAWRVRIDGAFHRDDAGSAVGVSPDGATVYAGGQVYTALGGADFLVAALDAATGAQLWEATYDFAARTDFLTAMAVSPDGIRVYATGSSYNSTTDVYDFATLGLLAADGTRLWAARYNHNRNDDEPAALAVSPSGGVVYVTGRSYNTSATGYDYATIAYAAGSGAYVWGTRTTGTGTSSKADHPLALGVSPDGSKVYVTGKSDTAGNGHDYLTVAYGAGDGAEAWRATYDGTGHSVDEASALAVAPDGLRVYVTGLSYGTGTGSGLAKGDIATLAYDATSGSQAWASRYDGPGATFDIGAALATSPLGTVVFVAGSSNGLASGATPTFQDTAVLAYAALTGAALWEGRYEGPGLDGATSLALGSSGERLVVGGVTTAGPGASIDGLELGYEGVLALGP